MRNCVRLLLYIFCVYIPEKEPNNLENGNCQIYEE